MDDDQLIEYMGQAGIDISAGVSERVMKNVRAFAKLISDHVREECAEICEELWGKCGGLPHDGALAMDCAKAIRESKHSCHVPPRFAEDHEQS